MSDDYWSCTMGCRTFPYEYDNGGDDCPECGHPLIAINPPRSLASLAYLAPEDRAEMVRTMREAMNLPTPIDPSKWCQG